MCKERLESLEERRRAQPPEDVPRSFGRLHDAFVIWPEDRRHVDQGERLLIGVSELVPPVEDLAIARGRLSCVSLQPGQTGLQRASPEVRRRQTDTRAGHV